jgi:predicted DNA-binding protein with PD1-like motif
MFSGIFSEGGEVGFYGARPVVSLEMSAFPTVDGPLTSAQRLLTRDAWTFDRAGGSGGKAHGCDMVSVDPSDGSFSGGHGESNEGRQVMADVGMFHAAGRFGKVVPVRLRTGTDLMSGLKQVCEANGIKHGALLAGIGSLRRMTYQVLTPKPETKLGAGYTEPQVVPGPVEIVSLQGVIFQSEEGETLLHVHGTFSDKDGKVYAGHVVAGENPVLATLDGLIAEVADVRLIRRMDAEVGLGLYTPEPL